MDSLPIEGEIYKGKVSKIESFGAFIEIDGFYANGLVHVSQMAKDRVEHPEDVVSAGQEVFVKVLTVDTPDNSRGRAKISLSMKYADQSTGEDRDRNGIDAEQEQQRRRSYGNNQQAPVTLEAIYNTVCSKCNGKGHIASECFNVGGTTYELIADDEDDALLDKANEDSRGRGMRSSPPRMAAVGRGRGATLPSWMTSERSAEPDPVNAAKEHNDKRKRKRSRSHSRDRDGDEGHKKKKDKSHKKKKDKKHKHKHKHKHHKSKSDRRDKKSHKKSRKDDEEFRDRDRNSIRENGYDGDSVRNEEGRHRDRERVSVKNRGTYDDRDRERSRSRRSRDRSRDKSRDRSRERRNGRNTDDYLNESIANERGRDNRSNRESYDSQQYDESGGRSRGRSRDRSRSRSTRTRTRKDADDGGQGRRSDSGNHGSIRFRSFSRDRGSDGRRDYSVRSPSNSSTSSSDSSGSSGSSSNGH